MFNCAESQINLDSLINVGTDNNNDANASIIENIENIECSISNTSSIPNIMSVENTECSINNNNNSNTEETVNITSSTKKESEKRKVIKIMPIMKVISIIMVRLFQPPPFLALLTVKWLLLQILARGFCLTPLLRCLSVISPLIQVFCLLPPNLSLALNRSLVRVCPLLPNRRLVLVLLTPFWPFPPNPRKLIRKVLKGLWVICQLMWLLPLECLLGPSIKFVMALFQIIIMALTIVTLNYNGLRDQSKRDGLVQWLRSIPVSVDVVCLQETHCVSSAECSLWFRSSGFLSALSPGSSHSCGCIVLFRPTLSLLKS